MLLHISACPATVSLMDTATMHSTDAARAGLDSTSAGLNSAGGWALAEDGASGDKNIYIFDFGQLVRIESVIMRGQGSGDNWIRTGRFLYSEDLATTHADIASAHAAGHMHSSNS